jgi:hypothetical protein
MDRYSAGRVDARGGKLDACQGRPALPARRFATTAWVVRLSQTRQKLVFSNPELTLSKVTEGFRFMFKICDKQATKVRVLFLCECFSSSGFVQPSKVT